MFNRVKISLNLKNNWTTFRSSKNIPPADQDKTELTNEIVSNKFSNYLIKI